MRNQSHKTKDYAPSAGVSVFVSGVGAGSTGSGVGSTGSGLA